MRHSALLCRAAGKLCSVMKKLPLTLMEILGSNQSSLWLCHQTRLLFWSVVDAAEFKAECFILVWSRFSPLRASAPARCYVRSLQQQWKDCFLPCSPTQLYKGFEAEGGSALACLLFTCLTIFWWKWAEKLILLPQTRTHFSFVGLHPASSR